MVLPLVNEADAFAYCVELIAIFGSVASGKERPKRRRYRV
jgi:hypothetical protein